MNPTTINENGEVIIHGRPISNIEVSALFLQYREGNRESMDREMLYAMIDILLNWVKEDAN